MQNVLLFCEEKKQMQCFCFLAIFYLWLLYDKKHAQFYSDVVDPLTCRCKQIMRVLHDQ